MLLNQGSHSLDAQSDLVVNGGGAALSRQSLCGSRPEKDWSKGFRL